MPQSTFSLHERALHTLLSVDERELRQLLTAFEWLADDPIGTATAAALNDEGQIRYAVEVGRFQILYGITSSGRHVEIADVRAASRDPQ